MALDPSIGVLACKLIRGSMLGNIGRIRAAHRENLCEWVSWRKLLKVICRASEAHRHQLPLYGGSVGCSNRATDAFGAVSILVQDLIVA